MFQKNTSKPKYLKSQDSSHLFKHINKSRWYLINLNLNSLNMKFVLHTYYSTLHFRCLGYGKNKISIWCWENREIPIWIGFGVAELYVAHYNLDTGIGKTPAPCRCRKTGKWETIPYIKISFKRDTKSTDPHYVLNKKIQKLSQNLSRKYEPSTETIAFKWEKMMMRI